MGRYDLRPLRVYDAAKLSLQTNRFARTPPWYQTVTDYPPSQALVRTQPVRHTERSASKKLKKPSRMFSPQWIKYEEDDLRHTFFADHPWELARPRILVEQDGKDYIKYDWSKPLNKPDGRPLTGESVVQRQMWLLKNSEGQHAKTKAANHRRRQAAQLAQEEPNLLDEPPLMTKAQAYDMARKEFYAQRHYDEIEKIVHREEALSTGAYFGKSALEVGMDLENQAFDRWRSWATEQATLQEQTRSAAYSGIGGAPISADDESAGSLENAVDQMGSLDGDAQDALQSA